MFMRFVHLKVPEGKLAQVRRFYEETVIPALQGAAGCLFASLLQPALGTGGDCLSMTLWRTSESADAYEASGLYDRLLDEFEEVTALTTDWRAELASERAVGASPAGDPVVEAYSVALQGDASLLEGAGSRLYVRIVAARVQAGCFDELKARYDDVVAPGLLATPGCRAAFLVRGVQSSARGLSVTVWDSEEDALRYEASGKFDELTAELSEFFSGLYMWKLSLVPSQGKKAVSGDDLDVGRYHVVTGKKLLP
jgi:heme-degrading monooxygenase HmoA